MKVKIEVECESVMELQQHLSIIKKQIKAKAKELKLVTSTEEFEPGTFIVDDNCYGSHELWVPESEGGSQ